MPSKNEINTRESALCRSGDRANGRAVADPRVCLRPTQVRIIRHVVCCPAAAGLRLTATGPLPCCLHGGLELRPRPPIPCFVDTSRDISRTVRAPHRPPILRCACTGLRTARRVPCRHQQGNLQHLVLYGEECGECEHLTPPR